MTAPITDERLRAVELALDSGLDPDPGAVEDIRALIARVRALHAFKVYVHTRLDDAGIPKEPNGPHSQEGCRIGDRLDIALALQKAGKPKYVAPCVYCGKETEKRIQAACDECWYKEKPAEQPAEEDEPDPDPKAEAWALLKASGRFYDADPEENLPPMLNMNDVWGWACACGLVVNDENVVRVAELYDRYGFPGLLYFQIESGEFKRSEFEDNQRFIQFVENEERIRRETPDSSARAYRKVEYTLSGSEPKQPAPLTPEESVVKAMRSKGVFAGMEGLTGLRDARKFWENQMYGTRLYFGPGIADYLHHSVLKTACDLIAEYQSLIDRLNAEEAKRG